MYPAGHSFVTNAIDNLSTRFNAFFNKQPSLTVGIGQDRIYLNEEELTEGEWVEILSHKLHEHSVSQISFHRGLRKNELLSFLDIFQTDPLEAKQSGGYKKLLASKGIASIDVNEVDYKLYEQDIEDQLLALSDIEVWQKIAQAWRPGRKAMSPDDRQFMLKLLSNAPRLATLLDTQVISKSKASDASEDIDSFFQMIQSMAPDKSDDQEKSKKYTGSIKQVMDILSTKTRYAMIQKVALDEKMHTEKKFVWDVMHEFNNWDLSRVMLEGLDPAFNTTIDFEKTYMHFVSEKREKEILANIHNLIRDRDLRHDDRVSAMIRRSKSLGDKQPALKLLYTTLSEAYEHLSKSEMVMYEFLESHYAPEKEIHAEYSETLIEQAACHNLLSVLELVKNSTNYKHYARGLTDTITALIHTGQYALASKSMDMLQRHVINKQILKENREYAESILKNIQKPELASELLEALSKWGKKQSDTICSLLNALGEASYQPTLEALRNEEDRASRSAMVEVLACAGDCVCPIIKRNLESDNWQFVRNLVALLAKINPDDLLDCLQPALESPEPRVRKEVAKAIAASITKEAIAPLVELATDEDQSVRQQAVLMLGRFREFDEAADALIDILKNAGKNRLEISDEVLAIESLGKIKSPNVLKYLSGFFSRSSVWKLRDEKLLNAVAAAIAKIDDPAAQKILSKGTKSLSGAIRRACKKALA